MSQTIPVPVGLWSGTVTYEGKRDEYTVGFAESGAVELTTSESTGQGSWTMTGDGTFSYTVKEYFHRDENGTAPPKVLPGAAYVQIDFDARLDGDTFHGTGTAQVRGVDGHLIHSTVAQTVAHQVPTN